MRVWLQSWLDRFASALSADTNRLVAIQERLNSIMSAISDFAAKQNAHNDKIDAAVAGLQGDIKFMQDQIAKLQASGGTLSAEDQATLDALDARGQAIADKLTALDAMTPPVPPAA